MCQNMTQIEKSQRASVSGYENTRTCQNMNPTATLEFLFIPMAFIYTSLTSIAH